MVAAAAIRDIEGGDTIDKKWEVASEIIASGVSKRIPLAQLGMQRRDHQQWFGPFVG